MIIRFPLGRGSVWAFARSGVCNCSIVGVITIDNFGSSSGFDSGIGCGVGEMERGLFPGKKADPSRSLVIAVILSFLIIFEKAHLLICCKPAQRQRLD